MGESMLGEGALGRACRKKVFSAKQGVLKYQNPCALHLRAEVSRPALRPPKLAQSPHSNTWECQPLSSACILTDPSRVRGNRTRSCCLESIGELARY